MQNMRRREENFKRVCMPHSKTASKLMTEFHMAAKDRDKVREDEDRR